MGNKVIKASTEAINRKHGSLFDRPGLEKRDGFSYQDCVYQSLFSCEEFRINILANVMKRSSSVPEDRLAKFFATMALTDKIGLNSQNIGEVMAKVKPSFGEPIERDAKQYLLDLLNEIHYGLAKDGHSFVRRIFEGDLDVFYKACVCPHIKSYKYCVKQFTIHSIDIQQHTNNIQTAIHIGNHRFHKSQCNKCEADAENIFKISKVSNYLLLALDVLSLDKQTNTVSRTKSFVKGFVSENIKVCNQSFKLYSSINYITNYVTNVSKYISITRINENWYMFDNIKVERIGKFNSDYFKEAYLLFYENCTPSQQYSDQKIQDLLAHNRESGIRFLTNTFPYDPMITAAFPEDPGQPTEKPTLPPQIRPSSATHRRPTATQSKPPPPPRIIPLYPISPSQPTRQVVSKHTEGKTISSSSESLKQKSDDGKSQQSRAFPSQKPVENLEMQRKINIVLQTFKFHKAPRITDAIDVIEPYYAARNSVGIVKYIYFKRYTFQNGENVFTAQEELKLVKKTKLFEKIPAEDYEGDWWYYSRAMCLYLGISGDIILQYFEDRLRYGGTHIFVNNLLLLSESYCYYFWNAERNAYIFIADKIYPIHSVIPRMVNEGKCLIAGVVHNNVINSGYNLGAYGISDKGGVFLQTVDQINREYGTSANRSKLCAFVVMDFIRLLVLDPCKECENVKNRTLVSVGGIVIIECDIDFKFSTESEKTYTREQMANFLFSDREERNQFLKIRFPIYFLGGIKLSVKDINNTYLAWTIDFVETVNESTGKMEKVAHVIIPEGAVFQSITDFDDGIKYLNAYWTTKNPFHFTLESSHLPPRFSKGLEAEIKFNRFTQRYPSIKFNKMPGKTDKHVVYIPDREQTGVKRTAETESSHSPKRKRGDSSSDSGHPSRSGEHSGHSSRSGQSSRSGEHSGHSSRSGQSSRSGEHSGHSSRSGQSRHSSRKQR